MWSKNQPCKSNHQDLQMIIRSLCVWCYIARNLLQIVGTSGTCVDGLLRSTAACAAFKMQHISATHEMCVLKHAKYWSKFLCAAYMHAKVIVRGQVPNQQVKLMFDDIFVIGYFKHLAM